MNYHKSEIILIHLEENEIEDFAVIFWCPMGSFPITYLDIPLHHDKEGGPVTDH